MDNLAEILKKANADSSGSSGSTSSNSDSTSGLVGDPRNDSNTNTTNNFAADALKARVLPEEKLSPEKAPEQELSADQLAQRKADAVVQKHGIELSAEEMANLKLSALGGGDMTQNLQKITGINPAILAMAAEAGALAKGAGMSSAQDHSVSNIVGGVAQVQSISSVVERSNSNEQALG